MQRPSLSAMMSRGSSLAGSGTVPDGTLLLPCQTSAFIKSCPYNRTSLELIAHQGAYGRVALMATKC